MQEKENEILADKLNKKTKIENQKKTNLKYLQAHSDDKEKLLAIVKLYYDPLEEILEKNKEKSYLELFDLIATETLKFYNSESIIDLYKLFDFTLDGTVSLIEFINGCRTKMTGLDQHNQNLIENSFKRAFRNMGDDNSKFTNLYEEKVQPEVFTKVCVSLMWFMKV